MAMYRHLLLELYVATPRAHVAGTAYAINLRRQFKPSTYYNESWCPVWLALVSPHERLSATPLVVHEERPVCFEPDRLAFHETELVGLVLWERHSLLKTVINENQSWEGQHTRFLPV